MTLFHFFNCALLAFGPHVVYYKATPLAEYGTLSASAKAAAVYFFTTLVKLLLWASLLKVSDDEDGLHSANPLAAHSRPLWHAAAPSLSRSTFDMHQELVKTAIGLVDLLGLYYALTRVTYRNISFSHKFQAVGLGWAMAQSITQRLAPLWFGAGGMEFKWEYMLDAINSNSELILGITLAALGSLLWLRKNKPPSIIPALYALAVCIISLPLLTSYLVVGLQLPTEQVATAQLGFSVICALVTWQLFNVTLK